VPEFQECFLGEGNFDPFQVVYALMHSGFDGFIVSDIKGLMEAIVKLKTMENA